MSNETFKPPRHEAINQLIREDFQSDYRFDPERSQRILIKCQGRIFYFSTHSISLDDPNLTHSICIDVDSAPVHVEEMISATSFPDSGKKWISACIDYKSQLILLDQGTVPEWCDNMSERYIMKREFAACAEEQHLLRERGTADQEVRPDHNTGGFSAEGKASKNRTNHDSFVGNEIEKTSHKAHDVEIKDSRSRSFLSDLFALPDKDLFVQRARYDGIDIEFIEEEIYSRSCKIDELHSKRKELGKDVDFQEDDARMIRYLYKEEATLRNAYGLIRSHYLNKDFARQTS